MTEFTYDKMVPEWQVEIMIEERLSQQRNRLIEEIKQIPRYGKFQYNKYDRLIRVNDVIEVIERSSYGNQ